MAEKLACAMRELEMRKRVYPRWIEQDCMTADKAAHELAAMESIVAEGRAVVLKALKEVADMTLTLHAGAQPTTFDALRAVPTPPPTDTYFPIAHHEIVEMMRFTLGFHGHEIVQESHAIMPDGARYFGLMTLRSSYGETYSDILGLRNAHDRSLSIGIAFGSRVFVCDNMAFIGDHVIRRKHSRHAKHELLSRFAEIVQPLQKARMVQHETLSRYQQTLLTDAQADHIVLELYRGGVVGLQRIPDVLNEWDRPTHDYGGKTFWRLFNAATFVLGSKAIERPKLTSDLHDIIDRACECAMAA
jgi:hypothetical protein